MLNTASIYWNNLSNKRQLLQFIFVNLRSYLHTNTSVYIEGNSCISSNSIYINTAHRLLGSNQYLESIQKLTILVTLFLSLEHTCTQMMISPLSWRVAHTQAFQCKQKEVTWRHNCYTCARTRRPPYLGIYDKPTTSHAFCCRMYTVDQLWLTSSKRAKNVENYLLYEDTTPWYEDCK